MAHDGKPLEDAFWTTRAVGLATRRSARGRTAILVRRGRVVVEHTEHASHPESRWQALLDARGGGTLYLSFAPQTSLFEASRKARLERIVTPTAEIDLSAFAPILTRNAS